jgi:hypothetical protein
MANLPRQGNARKLAIIIHKPVDPLYHHRCEPVATNSEI